MRKEERLMDLLGQLDDSFLVDLDDEVSTVLKEKRKKNCGRGDLVSRSFSCCGGCVDAHHSKDFPFA